MSPFRRMNREEKRQTDNKKGVKSSGQDNGNGKTKAKDAEISIIRIGNKLQTGETCLPKVSSTL